MLPGKKKRKKRSLSIHQIYGPYFYTNSGDWQNSSWQKFPTSLSGSEPSRGSVVPLNVSQTESITEAILC